MHLSIQFRHKATSTVSGEIETISDCAEATHCLRQNDTLQTSPGRRPIFTSDGSVDQLL